MCFVNSDLQEKCALWRKEWGRGASWRARAKEEREESLEFVYRPEFSGPRWTTIGVILSNQMAMAGMATFPPFAALAVLES